MININYINNIDISNGNIFNMFNVKYIAYFKKWNNTLEGYFLENNSKRLCYEFSEKSKYEYYHEFEFLYFWGNK